MVRIVFWIDPPVVGVDVGVVVPTGLTVRVPVPVLAPREAVPAKLAVTAPGKLPAAKLPRLTPPRVATPLALVVALPTAVVEPPLVSEKLTVCPPSGVLPDISVAVSVAVPPTVP